ncbi:trithorax group protein osa [Bicyclus anynana]|uniref:Trithorax group protein osa n=1 Tax=Bicyclus anynana TaxID=110368 RepID=A0A6J1NTF8_BICAN|nr:trithorax group protein osa [Bicyclus anynana]
MGCGQSKINLYPRKNKNGGKGNGAKKSGAADKETDEEEGSAGAGPADETEEDSERGRHILPLAAHPPTIEVSASMQDFFKMLDEKIEQGKDYDSSSETEIQLERERRKILIDEWRSASQSTHSSQSQPSPPTPARRRMPRPQLSECQGSPGAVRRCYRQQHVPEGMSPPAPRRSHSAQSHHPPDLRPVNGDTWHEPTKSPVKRPQSAGANWKGNPKVAPYNQKPKKNEVNENQRTIQKESDTATSQPTNASQDVSQITYNPTFQTHSPAHSAKSQQPYIAQIISYPASQVRQVTPPSPPKYIAPPEEYQDPQNNVDNKYNANQRQAQNQTPQPNQQSHIYYIHGNATANVSNQQDLVQQRQQTALHLQQYVAMKQAQQQMFTYLQRGPHTVFPNVDYAQVPSPRIYEGEEFNPQYGHPALRPHSAPPPVGVVRPMPITPSFSPLPDGSHVVQMPMWPHGMAPVVSTMGPWMPGHGHELQYYPQSQFMHMYRATSAGSAGTLTRYHKKEASEGDVKNVCQSINLVRQKQVGQIVSIPGQELTVCNNMSDSPSPASVSSDSGVSPGNSVPSSKASVFSQPPVPTDTFNTDNKTKKMKPAPYSRSLKNSKSLDS